MFSQVNKYTLSYRFLNETVHGCVFAENRPVSLNWTDYILKVILVDRYWRPVPTSLRLVYMNKQKWLRVSLFQIKQGISLKKNDIRRLSNTYNFNTTKWRNPRIPPVFACWKRMFHLKPSNLEVVVMFLVSLLLGALFAERYASESFQILGTSPAKAREQCYYS